MTEDKFEMISGMNEDLKKMLGLPPEAEGPFDEVMINLQLGNCPLCGNKPTTFRDQLSVKEFKVSGMCQDCQDQMFGVESSDFGPLQSMN